MLDHEGGALKTEIPVFIMEIPESSLCHMRTQQKLAVQNLEGGRPSWPHGHRDPDMQPPELYAMTACHL